VMERSSRASSFMLASASGSLSTRRSIWRAMLLIFWKTASGLFGSMFSKALASCSASFSS
jgi:hypothetical protein